MRRALSILCLLGLAGTLFAVDAAPPPRPLLAAPEFTIAKAMQPDVATKKAADPVKPAANPRGLIKTPKALIKLLRDTKPFKPGNVKLAASVAYVPKTLDMWGNDVYGDCVSAEEAMNQDVCGTFISGTVIVAWAKKYGYANGATLTDVMDTLQQHGFPSGGKTYSIGPYYSVDFSNENDLQAAISKGPVKIGIDANALSSGAGNKQGWFSLGGTPGQYDNEDHCVGLVGYGPAKDLYAALNVPLPASIQPTKTGYLLYTWKTIGFVDHDWLMSTCVEAYVRDPAQTINGVPSPNPGPGPNPTPPTPPVPPVPPTPVPPVPVPPSPTPSTANIIVITTSTGEAVTVDLNAKKVTTPASWTQGGPTSEQALKADLDKAGVNPKIILDVLKLLADIKAKADFATVILPDIMAIISDFKTASILAPHRWFDGELILAA